MTAARTFNENQQQLAVKIGEYIAMALTNLKLRDELRSQAIRDPLTRLFNRRYMEETLEREIRRAEPPLDHGRDHHVRHRQNEADQRPVWA